MRLLVAEDDARLAAHLEQGLKEQGYAVDLAADGGVCVDFALAVDYDAIILDLMLPRVDGGEVCRELRRRRRAMPILVLTARAATEDKVHLLDLGADDYLTKPFAFAELLARLRALLRRGPVEAQTVLRVADLELDPARRSVRRGNQVIALSARELALLEYLIRHAGQVLTRSMIADHVWNFDYEGGSNVVDVYVAYLRRKLDDQFEPKLIHTVRGVGYCLRAP